MAPQKRSRRDDDDDDDDEVVDVREAQSNFRGEQSRKRARVSLDGRANEPTPPREETPSSVSSDDSDSNMPDTPPQTQYELKRDKGFRHLENTEEDDRQATQKLQQRSRRIGDNMAAESGIVESITCYNFMCHERLHVELGPLINFIVGENGSGKSAVLTALTLCLGGKASDTNRGGSLKSFVKEGCDHGSLVVKIKNAGSDAYQPDIYGESIIVERHFTRTGNSGFKIKSATNRTISTKKQEIDEISEWYALQIGNPLTVLSQDNARQFLNSATPAQKYKYFISGVQLDQLDNDYKLSQDALDRLETVRDDLTVKVEASKKELDEAQRLAETAEKNQSLRARARHYRHQLAWSQVVEQERLLDQRNKQIEEHTRLIEDAAQECTAMDDALAVAREKETTAMEAKDQLSQEGPAYEQRIEAAEGLYKSRKKLLTDTHREERELYGTLQATDRELQVCKEKISKEERHLDESQGSARVEKERKLTEATAEEKEMKEEIGQINEQIPELQTKLQRADEQVKKAQHAVQLKRGEIDSSKRQINELENSRGTPYDGYDQDIVRLVKEIERATGFRDKPVGPLGAHITLAKPEWSRIIEKTIGDGLNAFVVTNKADQTRLSGLMESLRMKKQPPVYIAFSQRIDTRSQEPDDCFDTISRVLRFKNELVRSQLVINNQIEKIILVHNRVEAERIMVDNGTPPRNVNACICFHDGLGKRGQGLRITNRAGAAGTAPVVPTQQRLRIQPESGDKVALERAHLAQLNVELTDMSDENRQVQHVQQGCRIELEKQRKKLKSLEGALRRKRAEIENIQTELDEFEGADGRLLNLREELEKLQAAKERTGLEYGAISVTKGDLNKEVEEAKRGLEEEKRSQQDFQSQLRKAEEKIQSCVSLKRIAQARSNAAHERKDIETMERQRAEAKRDSQMETVERFASDAAQIVADRVHIPDDQTHKSIEAKFDAIMKQLKQREARLGATDQQIYDRALEARQQYEQLSRSARNTDEEITTIKLSIDQRLHIWRMFQRQISARVRIQFTYLLSERGFRGKIDLDHRARKVLIHVEPDETRKGSSGRNTKTLSGGEKSFSSICMLLSVWEAIGSPIRCLDEFDVFMDNVNRAISTNMLVEVARRSVARQYILITPNAIEGRARLDKDVKIIRLTDPRQRTLV